MQVTVLDKNAKNKIMFRDVAGCDEAKQEVMEFVSFLKGPSPVQGPGCQDPEGSPAGGTPRDGQDPAGQGSCRRSQCPLPVHQWF